MASVNSVEAASGRRSSQWCTAVQPGRRNWMNAVSRGIKSDTRPFTESVTDRRGSFNWHLSDGQRREAALNSRGRRLLSAQMTEEKYTLAWEVWKRSELIGIQTVCSEAEPPTKQSQLERLNAGRDVARGGRVFMFLYLCVPSCWHLSYTYNTTYNRWKNEFNRC